MAQIQGVHSELKNADPSSRANSARPKTEQVEQLTTESQTATKKITQNSESTYRTELRKLALQILQLNRANLSSNQPALDLIQILQRRDQDLLLKTLQGEALQKMKDLLPETLKSYLTGKLLDALFDSTKGPTATKTSHSPITLLLKELKSDATSEDLKKLISSQIEKLIISQDETIKLLGDYQKGGEAELQKIIKQVKELPQPNTPTEKSLLDLFKDIIRRKSDGVISNSTENLDTLLRAYIELPREDETDLISRQYRQILMQLVVMEQQDLFGQSPTNHVGRTILEPRIINSDTPPLISKFIERLFASALTDIDTNGLQDHRETIRVLSKDPIISQTLALLSDSKSELLKDRNEDPIIKELNSFIKKLAQELPTSQQTELKREQALDSLIRIVGRFAIERPELTDNKLPQLLMAEATIDSLKTLTTLNNIPGATSKNVNFSLPFVLPGFTTIADITLRKRYVGNHNNKPKAKKEFFSLNVRFKHPIFGELRAVLMILDQDIVGNLYCEQDPIPNELERELSHISTRLYSGGFKSVKLKIKHSPANIRAKNIIV